QAGGRGRAVRRRERAVRVPVGQLLADAAPEDDRRALARSGDAGAVLVLRRGVPHAVSDPAGGAGPHRRAGSACRRSRAGAGRGPGALMRTLTTRMGRFIFALCLAACLAAPAAVTAAARQPQAAQDEYVPLS